MSINLEKVREKYRDLYESSPDLIFIFDLEGKVLDINDIVVSTLGHEKVEIINHSIQDLVDTHDTEVIKNYIREIKKKVKISKYLDCTFKKKNGKLVYINFYGIPLKDNGTINGFLLIGKDLTDLNASLKIKFDKRTEELIESEEKYRHIIENSKDAIVIIGIDLNVFFVSPSLSEMLGGKEIKNVKTIFESLHPDDRLKIIERYKKAIKEKNIMTEELIEIRGRHKDGHYIWFSNSLKNYYDNKGNVIGFISLLRDVTKSKEAEQLLKESEEKYRLITENANDLITVINQKFEMEFLNEKPLLNIAGWKKEELLGKSAIEFMHPEDLNFALKALQKGQLDGMGTLELRLKHKNGNYIWVEIKGQTFKDKNGQLKGILIGRDTTEKKAIEKRLKESLERYRLITENANDLIGVINQNFIFEYINEEVYKKVLGYTKEELINKPALQFIHSEDLLRALNGLTTGFQKGEGMEEIRYKHKGNYYIWVQVWGKTFIDFDNQKKALIVARDISKQKEIERNLKSSEEKFRHLFERSVYSIILLDINGKVIDCNPPSEKLFLIKKVEFIGKNFNELGIIKLDELPLFKSSFENVLDGNIPESLEIKISRPNGNFIWINLQESLFSAGNDIFIQVIIQDITEKKVAESELRESVEKYRILIEMAPISIVLLDFKGIVLECNKCTETYAQLTRDRIIGKSIIDLYHLKIDQEQLSLEMFKATTSMENLPLESEYVNEAGQKLHLVSYISIVKISNEDLIQVVSQDITVRKEAETLILKEYAKLKELDEIKKEFVYRASHELKTPLNSVNVASAILLKYYEEILNERAKKLLRIINSGGERLRKLVEDLVEITRIESRIMKLDKKKENIVEITNNIVNEMTLFAKKRSLSLTSNLEGDFLLEIDKTKFEQVLSNLIVNAIKNTPEEGKISIEMEKTPQFLNIKVIDTGIGVTAEEKEKLFRKFGKIERHGKGMEINTEGSGLGLYISKEIVELHGGQLTVESEGKNKGATFIISLPIFLQAYK